MSAAAPRYAVYLAPAPEHPLWRLGCTWLGRDPAAPPPYAAPARAHVATPWRYGFHATLKAPLRLLPGAHLPAFLAAVRAVAARHLPFELPPPVPARLADFLALRQPGAVDAGHPLRHLADDAVLSLDRWRAPLTAAERERQIKPGLSARQQAQVDCLGYAFVLDDWRLHFTLSDTLADADAATWAALDAAARAHFAPALGQPWTVDALCVFVEPAPGLPFQLHERIALGASTHWGDLG